VIATSEWLHLGRRFFGSLRPGRPAPDDDMWAEDQLLTSEVVLWRRMSDADRRHAVGVARRTVELVGPGTERSVVAAALLHDVGKIESGLGPFRRAAATLAGKARGRERVRGRFGTYLHHDVVGAALLEVAGSDGVTVIWAREHHLPATRWSIEPTLGTALKAADDD
jgi:hypothetical protein